tara:strand:+ start:40 stop:1041 length:1002 start_codon:yes stop_codon:yes gene_type:complete
MASTYSSTLNLELQTTGENSGTWGTITNNNLQKLESAIKGYVSVAIASTSDSLTATDGTSSDETSNAIVKLTGTLTGNTTMQCEAVENWYIVDNAATMGTYTLGFKPAGGTATNLVSGSKHLLYTDGSTMFDVLDDAGNITANGTLDVAGNVNFNGGTFIYNEAGADLDARFEGSGDANLIYLDAGNDRIGIKTASPSTELHVVGGIKATGNIDFDGGSFTFNDSSADLDFRIESNGDANNLWSDGGNDRIGIGPSGTPGGKLEINQNSSTGAIPCLELDQDDADQPFIKFDGSSASDTSGNITTDTSIGDHSGFIRVNVGGTDRWIPFYATS